MTLVCQPTRKTAAAASYGAPAPAEEEEGWEEGPTEEDERMEAEMMYS